ncbi:hypothetical protein OIO90_005318 [Microbotryomycetes sp. JL221]|nr:hypothetical protein OIO90_005318 [Microbotryomycetes sp. JL221]
MDAYARRLALEHANGRDGKCRHSSKHDLVLQHGPLLHEILSQLPKRDLLRLCHVSRAFKDCAQRVMVLQGVRLETTRSLESFCERLHADQTFARTIKGFHVTRTSAPLLDELPFALPRLQDLTINAQVQLDPESVAGLLLNLPHLKRLTVIGQDARSRRHRLLQAEPEGAIGRALRLVSEHDERRQSLRLTSLSILSTPLKLSSIDRFLQRYGADLDELELDGCSLGPSVLEIVSEWCPNLRSCTIDTLIPSVAPPSTPRPNLPHLEFDSERSLGMSTRLTTLHLSSLPAVEPSVFAIFGTPEYSSLRTVCISHSNVTAFHLSHFAYVTKLRLVACTQVKNIPVFPDTSMASALEIGPGCKELQQLSVLGCTGLKLGNLWELAMLGMESLSSRVELERKRLGFGPRGLVKLTVDGAQTREQFFNIGLMSFAMPADLGTRVAPCELPSMLPPGLEPPATLAPLLNRNVLSMSVPSFALLSTLAMATKLEQVALFGTVDPSPFVDPTRIPADDEHLWTLKPSWVGKIKRSLLLFVPEWTIVKSYLGTVHSAKEFASEHEESEASLDRVQSTDDKLTVAQFRLGELPPLPMSASKSRRQNDVEQQLHRATRYDIVGQHQAVPTNACASKRGPRLSKEEVKWLLEANRGVLKTVQV